MEMEETGDSPIDSGGGTGTEDEEGGIAVINPLLNEDILEVILGYLDFKTLKKYRLVNSLWNLVSNRVLAPACPPIHFVGPEMCNWKPRFRGIAQMSKLISLLDTSWNFPCTKFILDTDLTSSPKEESILKSFLSKVAPWITHLYLNNNCISISSGFKLSGNIHFSCLKSFKFTYISQFVEDIGSVIKSVKWILTNSPDLETLHFVSFKGILHSGPDGTPGSEELMVIAFNTFLESVPSCSKIRNFTLRTDLDDNNLNKIVEVGLVNLKTLHIALGPDSRITPTCLHNLLELQSGSLKSLVLHGEPSQSSITLALPCIPNLKSLTIGSGENFNQFGYSSGSSLSYSGLINYAKQFPNLKRLSFWNAHVANLEEFLGTGEPPVETVEDLELPGKLQDARLIFQGARTFPQVKKLKVATRIDVMNAVYQAFENVEELTLVYGKREFHSVDQVLTGYSGEECEQIQGLSERLFEMVSRSTEPVPFLQRLKVLRIVRIENCDNDHETTSDISCRMILLKMRALTCLDFGGRRPALVSNQVIQEMKQRFRVLCTNDDDAVLWNA